MLQVYIENIELRDVCLDAGMKVPRAPKYSTAASLHRNYRKI